jgi:acyl-CoA thioesterase YciA
MPESYVAMQTVMMPRDANPQGTIFGGVILSLIDMGAHTAAKRFVVQAGGPPPVLVTVAINRVEFKEPVFVGDVVRCLVSLGKFGTTSVTVKVTIEADRGLETIVVTEAEVVFVGIDNTTPQRKPKALFAK